MSFRFKALRRGKRQILLFWGYKPNFMTKQIFFILFLAFSSTVSSAQELTHRLGEILISVAPGVSVQEGIDALNLNRAAEEKIQLVERVSDVMNIWLLSVDPATTNEQYLLRELNALSWIKTAQFNHLILNRTTIPNDPRFDEQWHYLNDGSSGGFADADIDADEAWDLVTGGMTGDSKEIVIAIIDDGIDLNHPDLVDNIWVNTDETPNNALDDDNNGYVDDIFGWNARMDNGMVNDGNVSHGVQVAGMAGAIGNNGEGITGINWNVKIMVTKRGSITESNAIKAYSYILNERRLYNESGGTKGAFVVSTNSSWGIDGTPDDAPLWCAFYDSLGAAGIVSVAATKNANVDIDQVSDLPTGCPSEYLISVTASNDRDLRTFSAYGMNTIDIAAPGQDVLSTYINDGYRKDDGTSFASPLVAGMVGLLYSAKCNSFQAIANSDPAAAAKLAIKYILEGVDQLPQFENELSSKGRLNAFGAIQQFIDNCLACPPVTSVSFDQQDQGIVSLSWSVADSVQVNMRVKHKDSSDWIQIDNVNSPTLLDLGFCNTYYFQFQSVCPSDTGVFDDTFSITTDGCCDPPTGLFAETNSMGELEISWSEITAAQSYGLLYRIGGASWKAINDIGVNMYNLGATELCELYEFQVRTVCQHDTTAYSEVLQFFSPSCQDCDTLPYCQVASGIDSDFEWIDEFELAGYHMQTGNNDGYGDFTGLPFAFLSQGSTEQFKITQAYSGATFTEYFRIWIDYNQNGSFEDEGELVYDSGVGITDPAQGFIEIPQNAIEGNTRLRIAMKFVSDNDQDLPESCPDFEGGEVEDYCIVIRAVDASCPVVSNIEILGVMSEEALISWMEIDTALAFNIRYRTLGSSDWQEMATLDTFITLGMLETCKTYELGIRTVCPFDTSAYSGSITFDSDCPNAIDEGELAEEILKIYPNPTWGPITLEWYQDGSSDGTIWIFDSQGKQVYNAQVSTSTSGVQKVLLEDPGYQSPGLYFIRMKFGDQIQTSKFILQ